MPDQAWTSEFRKDALARIREYESFLDACGIAVATGTELEFHFYPKDARYVKPGFIKGFGDSPFVEKLDKEEPPTPRNVGEIVLGAGPKGRNATYPRERSPHTMALATASAKKIVGAGADDYGMDVDFGESAGKRVRSLQCNASLWDGTAKTPLFLDIPFSPGESGLFKTNALTVDCMKTALEAQHGLSALVAANDAAFHRHREKQGQAFGATFETKFAAQSLTVRKNTKGSPYKNRAAAQGEPHGVSPSLYFEDRLASSEADPALAMLITVGGMAEGVKTYMRARNLVDEQGLPDPQKFQAHLHSPAFTEGAVSFPENKDRHSGLIKAPWNYALPFPKDRHDALEVLKADTLAKKIMGGDFHRRFCVACQEHAAAAVQDHRGNHGL